MSFITNFDIHLAPKLETNSQKLVCLLQYCEERIRAQLEYFTKKPENGYKLARQRLFEEYGQPHIIAGACERVLKEFPSVRDDKPEQLLQISQVMERCLGTLEDIDEFANVNTLDTMGMLMAKLPEDVQDGWPHEALRIQRKTGRQAKYCHLVDYVCNWADVKNSMYGKKLNEIRHKKIPVSVRRNRAATYNIDAEAKREHIDQKRDLGCVCCLKPHNLWNCPDFKSKSHEEKEKSKKPEEGPAVYSLAKSSKCNGKSIGQDVYLCVVPVNVRNGEKTAQTYALLDPASTVTLCSERLMEYLEVTGNTRDITLRTIGQRPIQYKGISGSLVVSPLDGGAEHEITDVLSVEKIPAKPNKAPDQRFLKIMPHLQDVRLPILEGGTVNLLIGADNAELVCFQDVRNGPRKAPKAVKTVLGWSLFGPSFESPSDIREVHFTSDHYVNFVKCNDLETQKEIETLWTTDFGNETSVLDIPNSREDRAVYEIMQNSVKHIGGHFQLPLPWRTGMQYLPDNKEMAKKRLLASKID
uniref:uncharacterized protein LOC120335116 n=1 Tax=Styela clava TaxID=7725 RepID=UPI001939D777|nr:uncharacterized protein LOC120335116 [Styela clava]